MPTEKRVRRWALSMEELVADPTGEFTEYEFGTYTFSRRGMILSTSTVSHGITVHTIF